VGLLGAAVVAGGLVIGLGTERVADVARGIDRIEEAFPEDPGRPETGGAAEGSLTFLVLGIDRADWRTGETRAEASLLVRLTQDRQNAQVIALPVDTWVADVASTVGGAFDEGGPADAVRAVESLTGVRVDHYAELDLAGLATVTEALGGITVDVPEAYRNDGHSFATGPQRMEGARAVAYVSDADRAAQDSGPARLQRVVRAMFTRIDGLGGFRDVDRLVALSDSVADVLQVDDGLADQRLLATAWEFRGTGAPDFVSMPLQGTGTVDGRPVVHPDERRAADLWAYLREDALAEHLHEFR
jgi:LCP family protein required for cell wall assembly